MKKFQERDYLQAEDFWSYTLARIYDGPTCERTEARFLAFLCALSRNPSVLAPTSIIEIANGITAVTLHKTDIKLQQRNKTETLRFGLDTRIVLNGFLAGTIFDLDPNLKFYRPLLNIAQTPLEILTNSSYGQEKDYYDQARKDLQKVQDPIKLLVRYLRKRGIKADEAQMKINSERFISRDY